MYDYRWQKWRSSQSFDIAIGIINNPRNLNNQELINELQVLIPFYEKPSVASSQSQLLMRVIRLAFLRIIHATELESGDVLECDEELSHRLLELILKYTRHPQRNRPGNYGTVRNILFTYFSSNKKNISWLTVWYDWLIASDEKVKSSKQQRQT